MTWRRCKKKPIVVHFRELDSPLIIKNDIDGRSYTVNPETHYIIRGVKGEIYSIEKKIFHESYEVLENDD